MNNLNMRLFLAVALLGGIFFLANCGGGATNTTTTNTASTDSVGVAECDEYIKKYEACLTKIAKDAPQAQPGLKSGFDAQRKAFKDAAANPQSKAALASSCKQAIETAKQSTAAYKCEW
jgi:hypothetical protein